MKSTIRFITPVALLDVIARIAPEFERSTGHQLELLTMLNPEVPSFIRDGSLWSLAASNPWHLEEVEAHARGPVLSLGHSPLAFGSVGQVETAINDEAGITEVLRRAGRIGVTGAGTSGGTFGKLLDTLDLADEMRDCVIPLEGGEPMSQLIAGEIDLAVLPLTNIAPVKGVRPVVICPWEMEVHIDLALCLHRKTCSGAQANADRLKSTERKRTLEALEKKRSRRAD